ncbi:integral membrane protein S linking to the trans Golgi network-domain-containing protein [Phaeosphaeria sp. MPI-PUGE-AT-0046c]|nr:integral membrane protein S linking to the trans Golgi network-domain-containing protein [Phaeosphaeria sp. MPI-PUGE-AT-0046c]
MPRRRRPPRPGALADLSPTRILTQIVLLQLAYYACAAVLIVFTAIVAGKEVSTDLLLNWRSLRGDTTVGWTLGLVWVLNSLICAIFILLLIARSKLVLDFALTVHFIHLVVTSLYSHAIPANLLWWMLQICSATVMTSVGVWACQWRELKPINFGGKPASKQSETVVDDGVGESRGRGRGRGRDGAGEYELADMNEGQDRV